MDTQISERVRQVIEDSGFNDAEISKKTDVSQTTVWRWRTGETQKFPASTLRKIADALQVDYNFLRTGKPEANIIELLDRYKSRKEHRNFSDKEHDLLLEFLIAQTESLLIGLHRLKDRGDNRK